MRTALKRAKTAYKRIKTNLDGKFSDKTKKVLYLRILYSEVTHSELHRKKLKLKLSGADGLQTGQKLHTNV